MYFDCPVSKIILLCKETHVTKIQTHTIKNKYNYLKKKAVLVFSFDDIASLLLTIVGENV